MGSPFKRWWTVTVLIFSLYSYCLYAQQCSVGDRNALLEFKAGFIDSNVFATWEAGTNCCVWNGVNCTRSGRVQSLQISNPYARHGPSPVAERNTSYEGFVGATLGDLSELRTLELQMVLISGPMPNTFNKLLKLETLILFFNDFRGALSPSIGGATSLKNLRVDGRSYWWPFPGIESAPIPSTFCNLIHLQSLELPGLGITGEIPPCFCRFSQLTRLNLSENHLVSEIPNCIGHSVRRLEYFSLASNKITDPIPRMLGQLTKLQQLDLSQNKFSGSIPPEIGNLMKLTFLNLGNNSLSGPIPALLGRLTNLNFLDLSQNFLTHIPPALGNLVKLGWLSLSSNKLQGRLPPEIGNCGSRAGGLFFDISNNTFSGSIPNVFGSGQFSTFFAANNFFSGGFPLTLSRVNSTDLSNNFLWDLKQVGTLPLTPSMYYLRLANNRFSGPVPSWFKALIARAQNLRFFDISVNRLTGPFPPSFLGVLKDGTLNASNNMFTGQLPTQAFSASWEPLDLSHNRISGLITSTFFASLINCTHIDLSFNMLSGPLPKNSGEFQDLFYLDLSDNELTGTVPASIEKIPTLEYLDLSNNRFTGRVPSIRPPPLGVDP